MNSARNSKIENRNLERVGIAKGSPSIRDFKDLNVWRAALSVTANIAEGFGRFGYQENAQFCRQARGSLYELRDHLTACVDEGYLSLAEGRRVDALAQRVAKILNAYIRSTLALKGKLGQS